MIWRHIKTVANGLYLDLAYVNEYLIGMYLTEENIDCS
jgi:hypothetical protein